MKEKEIRLSIRISEHLKQSFQAAADDRGISLSEFIKIAAIEKIAREEK